MLNSFGMLSLLLGNHKKVDLGPQTISRTPPTHKDTLRTVIVRVPSDVAQVGVC